jgi:hypothetical protein
MNIEYLKILENQKRYNIIGVYEFKEDEKCESPTNHMQLRNDGFTTLSNKKEISRRLTKSKFCEIKIRYGSCFRKVCYFAHSIHEIIFPDCAFKEECKKKRTCMFKHPSETNDQYKQRIDFVVPQNMS